MQGRWAIRCVLSLFFLFFLFLSDWVRWHWPWSSKVTSGRTHMTAVLSQTHCIVQHTYIKCHVYWQRTYLQIYTLYLYSGKEIKGENTPKFISTVFRNISQPLNIFVALFWTLSWPKAIKYNALNQRRVDWAFNKAVVIHYDCTMDNCTSRQAWCSKDGLQSSSEFIFSRSGWIKDWDRFPACFFISSTLSCLGSVFRWSAPMIAVVRFTAVRALVWNNGTLQCKIDFNRNLSF